MTAPTFPAFIRLQAQGTDDAKAKFFKAVDELCSKGESRTNEFAATAQTNIDRALRVPPGAASTFSAEIDRMAVLATTKLDSIAASARRNLDAALSGRMTPTGAIDVDVAGARQAAAVAEQRAIVARQLAQATQASALAERDFTQAMRGSIAAAKDLADKETQAAAAARLQADAAEKLQMALNRAGVSAQSFGAVNDNVARTSGAARQGMLQLGYQIGDAATMFSLGSNASQIFASQLGQTVQAVQLMTGGTSRLAAFLGGPWGIALSTATIVAAPFIGKLWETYSAANAATGALEELIKKQRQQQAEKNRVPNAQKDIDALVKRRAELEADIAKRGVRNPATGGLQFVFKQQKELKEVNAAIMEGRAALDAERAGTLTLDRAMGDLTVKRLKDSYATEKQAKAKVAKVKADRDEVAELNKQLAAEISSIQKYADWNEKGLTRGLDRGMAGMMDAMASGQRRATNDLIKAADATGAWNDQLADTIALLEQVGGAGRALAGIGNAITALSTGNYSGVRGPAGALLQTVGGIGWAEMDSDGNRQIKLLGEEITDALDAVFGNRGSFAKMLESAGIGSAASTLILGKGGNGLGAALGGVLGKEAGEALGKGVGGLLGKAAGPIGSIVGGVLGGALGGLLKSTKTGFSVISNRGVTSGGSSRELTQGAQNTGDSIAAQLSAIADRLGGSVGDYAVSIGTRSSGYIRVSASGSSDVAGKNFYKSPDAIYDGKDPAEAARIALLNAIQDGAIQGVRAGAQQLLKAGKDVEQALQKALDFEGVFTSLKGYRDPVGAALDTLDREFVRLQKIFTEAGASAAEYADLEALYGIRRAEAIDKANDQIIGSLKDLQKALTVGNDTLSLRDRNSAALAVYNPLADRVRAGDVTAFDSFSQAAGDLLDIQRQIYGSTGAFYAMQDQIKALTDSAISGQTTIATASANRDSPFSDSAVTSTVNAIDAQTSAIVSALENQLGLRLDALNDNTIAVWKQLAANGASSASAISALAALPSRGFF